VTTAQKVGALGALAAAFLGAYLGLRPVTNPSATRACIPFQGTKPAGLYTTRAVVMLSPLALQTLGDTAATSWRYAAVEVQASGSVTATKAEIESVLGHVEIMEGSVEDRTSQGPVEPLCQVLVVRDDDPPLQSTTILPCACSTGANCTVGGQPAKRGVTLNPGTFTGTGCFKKICSVLMGYDSWPSVCPVN
jgi:hypothetical protein